ncbi:MAG: methylated-DNA--[protein]-cysteine S-methyltransferase [Gallionella sp.]
MDYQAKLSVPFGVLGVRCTDDALTGIEFLAPGIAPQPPGNDFAQTVYEQLSAYLIDPDFRFNLPISPGGTVHQNKVWQAMRNIPRGETRSYGELAAELKSGAQAVGQACGANPIPIVIPCHRVVGKSGLGGFMRHAGGAALDIKRWLLVHEAATPSPLQGEGWGEGRSVESPLMEPLAIRLGHQKTKAKSLVIPPPLSPKGRGA